MDTLYIVMPAYNEEANIETVISQWYPILNGKSEDSRIVIADSGSTDKTHSILNKLKITDYPKLEILSDTERFHGPKIIALYSYAIDQEADYIFQTDSDGQTDPGEFGSLWSEREKYMGLFGNRLTRGDGKIRALIEKVVCFLLRLYFRVKIPDANAPFRLMRADTIKKYLSRLPSDYALPNIMITTLFIYYHEPVRFVPISFKPRQGGTNSLNLVKIFKIGCKTLKDFAIFRKEMINDPPAKE